ncbi:Flocculation protein FLO11 [Caenorhabditis elegans]|uniref:Flocculation protein FLO11 n=1 Tax=Caenorhabditis elegans TaxID=6239 RepID=A0A679L8V4_CAEEL|nr:Flocculation protein FLO11 [Caenorhabditis elegans]CAA9991453.1 Flocculation protein FLO11 [Caenorhabditis elegans]
MAAATATAAATSKKMTYEFTIDDDELSEDGKPSTDQATMCNIYKLNLPASASILSKQIAKSQAKRAKKEERHRRRVDLSTVREQDETRVSNSEENSQNASPRPMTASALVPPDEIPDSAPASHCGGGGGRSRIDSAPLGVKLQRQASLPEDQRKAEPMDEEEAELLAMLLGGIERNERKQMTLNGAGNQKIQEAPIVQAPQIPPSPGLPRLPPGAKVSEWLLERSSSPDNVSVISSVLLEDSGLLLNYQNSVGDEEEDVFFDAEEEKPDDVVNCVEHELQGLSLNRNMAAMTQSLVRVEEETTTTDGPAANDSFRTGRSTSVSPRPTNEQFLRNTNGSATFNVKHSPDMNPTLQKSSPPVVTINPLTPSRPASVASSIGARSGVNGTMTASNLEGLQDLIQQQEDALRRAALNDQSTERKMSWQSDQDANNRQSTSVHSSLGSICSSKSIDGAHALSKMGTPTASRIPTPRSRLPTPRGSNLPKRVHSVAAAVRLATSKPESSTSTNGTARHFDNADECF